ncbi:MAG: hypothetical protein A2Z66_12855 [Chloroflexi bacterium RBG_13_66_10]|nr:MAG: hypothetical protein A2Z66_12855 [Chloroflexi bacterium RBG_13_66_10]
MLDTAGEQTAPVLDEEILNIDLRHICRAGILELMRIGAGLSYKELGRGLGLPPIKVRRYVCGTMRKPRQQTLFQIWRFLWERIPAQSPEPTLRLRALGERLPEANIHIPGYLTLEEAAAMMKLRPSEMRRLVSREPEIGAIKVGVVIRIPRDRLCGFIADASGSPPGELPADLISIREAAELLRVEVHVLHYAMKCGRLKGLQASKKARIQIGRAELSRFLMEGTAPIPDPRDRERRSRMKRKQQQEAHA